MPARQQRANVGGELSVGELLVHVLFEHGTRDVVAVMFHTAELLMHDAIAAARGAQGQADALARALTTARMRVPPEHLMSIRRLERKRSRVWPTANQLRITRAIESANFEI